MFSPEEEKTHKDRGRRRWVTRGQWVEPGMYKSRNVKDSRLPPAPEYEGLLQETFIQNVLLYPQTQILLSLCCVVLTREKPIFWPKKKKPLWPPSLPALTPSGQSLTPFLVFRDCVSVITSRFSHKSKARTLFYCPVSKSWNPCLLVHFKNQLIVFTQDKSGHFGKL